MVSGDEGYNQNFGQPFESYHPTPMAGHPFGQSRGFGGPLIRGIDN
jgi:hypothetical protein